MGQSPSFTLGFSGVSMCQNKVRLLAGVGESEKPLCTRPECLCSRLSERTEGTNRVSFPLPHGLAQ